MDSEAPLEQTPARRLIEALGGVRAAARKLGRKPTTVQYWLDTGLIPGKQQQNALETAQREGVAWSPADFFPHAAQAASAEASTHR